jgi:hypothetical protein
MPLEYFCPRLSEAKTFLPLLRAELLAVAPRYTLPVTLSPVDLLPIVEDGLFGYELIPDRRVPTYLAIGRDKTGRAVLRRSLYPSESPSALRLVTINGKSLVRERISPRGRVEERDDRFPEIFDAVESALGQLAMLFPEKPRKPIELHAEVHRYLDDALATAHAYLLEWNPRVEFCGLPDEAQFGFRLTGDHGERGELVSQRPDMWVLRWKSAARDICEEWSVMLPPPDALGAIGIA